MTEPTIKAKPTEYRGVLFRSRLEARAAAAFDRQRWTWRYEYDTYQAGGTGYIPDFYVVQQDGLTAWIEVKPNMAMVEDDHKARQFARTTTDEVFYGVEGESFLHRPEDPWDSEVWVTPLHLWHVDADLRKLTDTGRFLILPQYQDGRMMWPGDE